ncbi:hypothetical protein CR513_60498, partial [Mucuna pruriens]
MRGTQKEEKLMEAVNAMRGHALKWWCRWNQHYSHVNCRTFSVAFLWRFSLEYKDTLPITDEEEELELEPLLALGSFNGQQQGSYQGNQISCENNNMVETMEVKYKMKEKHEAKNKSEIVEKSQFHESLNEAYQANSSIIAGLIYHIYHHPIPPFKGNKEEMNPRITCVIGIKVIIILCFLAKSTTQNRAYDLGRSSNMDPEERTRALY